MYQVPLVSRAARDGDLLISFEGEIDLTNAETLRSEVDRTLTESVYGTLVVDLVDVRFVDRAGRCLLRELRRMHKWRGFRVVVATPSQPARIMRLGRLDVFFPEVEYVPRPPWADRRAGLGVC